jgi:hypothetical protein
MSISSHVMRKFVIAAAEELNGVWVIIGGSVLHLLDISDRQTEDIDLAGPIGSTQEESLKLMELAESFGLPIEAINQAGAFFLRKIDGWENKIIEVHQGSKATIYRPNLELFFELKLARLTEADVMDCISYLDYTVKHKEFFDRVILTQLCESKITLAEKQKYKARLLNSIP